MIATAVPLWNVAAFGWSCVGRQQHANTTVDTWTAGHDVLVLVWENEASVVAAVLNGEVLEPDQIGQLAEGPADDLEKLLDRVAHRAEAAFAGRVGTELEHLFDAGRRTVNARGALPLRMRAALHNLALAVLSTPPKD
jgi:hypothetical protein